MTICIAAVSYGYVTPFVPRIALCADWQTASPQGSSETTLKLRPLPHGWFCLTSGSMVAIPAIVKLIRSKLQQITVDEVTLRPALCEAVEEYKQQLAHEIASRFAMSLDEFKRTGKERLPPDLFSAAWRQITDIKLGAEFIVLGFIAGDPTLIKIEDDGRVSYREQYVTIGDGGPLAMTALLNRKQRQTDTLSETLYNIYEAKRYAETLPSVGRNNLTLGFLAPDSKFRYLPLPEHKVYADLYAQYGPKPVPSPASVEVDIDKLFASY